MQSRNQLCLPPMFLERTMQVLFREDRKSRSNNCFSVVASLNVHSFSGVPVWSVRTGGVQQFGRFPFEVRTDGILSSERDPFHVRT
jgi:hypothetical protein